MLRTFTDGLKTIKEIENLLKEVDNGCKKTIASVRSNGVILEELKQCGYDFKNHKRNS